MLKINAVKLFLWPWRFYDFCQKKEWDISVKLLTATLLWVTRFLKYVTTFTYLATNPANGFVSYQVCGDLFCLLRRPISKEINITSIRAPRFKRRLAVYNFISFLTMFLSAEGTVDWKNRSRTRKNKKTRLWSKLKTGFLAKNGIQKKRERSAHVFKKGCWTESLMYSKE